MAYGIGVIEAAQLVEPALLWRKCSATWEDWLAHADHVCALDLKLRQKIRQGFCCRRFCGECDWPQTHELL